MSGWMSMFGGRRDTKATTRDAIVSLRQQLTMLEKKEEYTQKKIEEETRKAKANAVSNKPAALAALKRKKQHELELDRIQGTRLTLDTQANALESANINATTMEVMKKGAEALKAVHGSLTIDKVDATMDSIREQMELQEEISNAISNPMIGQQIDEDELKTALEDLEREQLDDMLMGADRVPQHVPGGTTKVTVTKEAEEDEEERQLRELQASLAM